MSRPTPWMHPGGWRRLPMRRWHNRLIARLYDIWLIASGQQTLHRAWQKGHDQGCQSVYARELRASLPLETRPWPPSFNADCNGAPQTQQQP